ncbi:hypothetical protein OQA88_5111 [Cercophora sp. LCS_1]
MSTTDNVAGSPGGHFPLRNAFDFIFSQPFLSKSDFAPANRVLPLIEDSRPIFVDNASDRALTYGRLRQDALSVASGLLSLPLSANKLHTLPPTPSCPAGAQIAPVVLIQLPNGLPIAPILLGVFAAGLTATLVSPALTPDEISWILQNARPAAIITSTACLANMTAALGKQTTPLAPAIYTVSPTDTYPLSTSPSSSSDWKSLLQPVSRPRPHFPDATAPSRSAVLLWSSGTSGRSKGVLLSHHALNFSIGHLWHDAEYYTGSPQSWLGYVPFYHVFGLCNVLLLAIATGTTVYTMPAFSLDGMLSAVEKRKVTYLHMAPPVAVMLAKAPVVEPYVKRGGFKTVVAGVTGGAPLGHEVVVEVWKRCGFRVRLGYGLSETCSTALQRGIGREEMDAHAGDTGAPHWGVEIRIDGPKGGEGEILVRAPCLMMGYLPEAGGTDVKLTWEAMTSDGWFRTGDVGRLEGGRLRITDRLKELIKVRAYQVAPAELEAVLCSSESVADAGVIGIYDQGEATEWPKAFVVPRRVEDLKDPKALEKLAEEVKTLVEKRLTKYKWLVGGVVFVEQIPKSPSGKILRRVLKDMEGKGITGVEVQLYKPKKRATKL